MTLQQLVIVAGPNGSGKSTLTDQGELKAQGIDFPAYYINPDRIAMDLAQQEPNLTQKEREDQAQKQGRALRQQYREQGVSFAFETVFSHPSNLRDMQECKKAGYEVCFVFVTTGDVEINVARVAGRVLQGKHNVPEDKIRDRYKRTMRLLPRAVEEAHRALVFDSSREEPMRLCFIKRNFAVPLNPPPYLQTGLAVPLQERRADRDGIAQNVDGVSLPDETVGEYSGAIVAVLPHYAVQNAGASGMIRHDRLLFPQETDWARVRSVRYKDAAGSTQDI